MPAASSISRTWKTDHVLLLRTSDVGLISHYARTTSHSKIRRLGETVCIMCRSNPKQGDRHYCGKTCAEDAANKGPTILEVPEGHVTFNSGKKNACLPFQPILTFVFSVAEQFKTSWRHPNKPCPPVKGIYKIVGSKESLVKFDAYR